VSGDGYTGLDPYLWHSANSNHQTQPVKSKLANAFGIYRSVSEWAADYYDKTYAGSTGLDPQGPPSGWARIIRGDDYGRNACYCRSAYRNFREPEALHWYLGFRLVRALK
jgi:formylglycine-generating enzyme required for sulfatase activity